MPAKKRTAEDAGEGSAKATKAARTEKNGGTKRGAKKAAAKAPTMSSADFKATASPLYLSLTHTPSKEENADEKEAKLEIATGDAGFIGALTLDPNVFSTGSYGWKGNAKIAVELPGAATDAEGKKESVQVMLTVNATVIGSKNAPKSKGPAQDEDASDHDEREE